MAHMLRPTLGEGKLSRNLESAKIGFSGGF
jgi:hypothetical protein